jgi:glycosidase/uncharacterized protein YaiE (UPF0345 family)
MKKWMMPAGACLLVGVSLPTMADYYFRGTANSWAATAMTAVTSTQYETCQSFASGDATGGPRFKIDRYGDWRVSYPTADYTVSANTSYQIAINTSTNAVTATAVTSCSSTPTPVNEWFFRGTSNSWVATAMALRADGQYCSDQTFGAASTSPRFKIDRYGDWKEAYPAADYVVAANTSYTVCINPTSKVVTATAAQVTDTQAPVAATTPAAGSYTGAQSIKLTVSDNQDTAAKVYYTLDGSTPTTSSTLYAGETILSPATGTLTIKTLSVDASGNQQQQSFAFTISATSVDNWYFRGTPNGWAATAMTLGSDGLYCTTQQFGAASTNPRFKIDHKGDWTEAYPTADYVVSADTSYKVCFNATSKQITATGQGVIDTQAPVVNADPAAGSYTTTQFVKLTVTDNTDAAPKVYFTLDGTEPTTSSTLYSGQTFTAEDKVAGSAADLTVKTLAVDASNNQSKNTFTYMVGPEITSGDFRGETIYFVMTARFNDGDPSNNYYNRDRYKAGDPQWRGDFKGLIAQLDYIKDLGFTAIWVTPPVENRSGLDYHGYHAYDWYKVDPRLESTDATYQDFINAAHAKGMKVIQDVVINHSSQYGIRDEVWIDHLPVKYYVPAGATQGQVNNGPYQGNLGDYQSINRDDNDNAVAPSWFQALHNSDPQGVTPFVDPKTGTTLPKAGFDANRFFGIDAATLDPAWYHLDGFMSGGDWENPKSLQRKHMAGDCVDLATENQNVKDYLNGAIHKYLDMGVDAIRLDTAKHIERNELLTYTQNWQAYKPGLFVFGEVLVKGAGFGSEITNDNASAEIRPWWYTRTGSSKSQPSGDSKLSVFDFPLFSTFRDNVTKGSLSGIKGVLDFDWTYADPTQLVTFFQNHDVGPDNDFKYRYGGEPANAALAYNLLWTVRGIPALYYGEEVMFQAGLEEDINGNSDTLDQTGRAYFGDKLANRATLQANPLYQHIKRLNQIRKAIPALQKGTMLNVNEWGNGMSFVRDAGTSYAVVGLATGSSQSITVSGVKNGTYRDAVTGREVTVGNGSLTFTVNPYSIGAYVLSGPGKIGADGNWLK